MLRILGRAWRRPDGWRLESCRGALLLLLVACGSPEEAGLPGSHPDEGSVALGEGRRIGSEDVLKGGAIATVPAASERPDRAGRAPGTPVEAVDDVGRRVVLAEAARRIVSLQPAITEMLLALGAGERLVARTDFDEDPRLAHLPSIGGGLTPSLEAIAALESDLVIAWEEAGTARIRPRLEALGISVFATRTQDTTAIFSTIERLGVLTGLESSAASLLTRMRHDLAEVAARALGRERPRVLYLVGLEPPMVATPKLFIGEILEVAGGKNVFAELTTPTPQVSLEEIVRRRPEIVLVPASGASSAPLERLRNTPGWRELALSGETRFVALPPDLLHRPGPGIVDAARILHSVLYPETALSR